MPFRQGHRPRKAIFLPLEQLYVLERSHKQSTQAHRPAHEQILRLLSVRTRANERGKLATTSNSINPDSDPFSS